MGIITTALILLLRIGIISLLIKTLINLVYNICEALYDRSIGIVPSVATILIIATLKLAVLLPLDYLSRTYALSVNLPISNMPEEFALVLFVIYAGISLLQVACVYLFSMVYLMIDLGIDKVVQSLITRRKPEIVIFIEESSYINKAVFATGGLATLLMYTLYK